jgi:hypothetical protein
MWDGVGFTLSLSGSEETPEVVHLALVEKVQVLGGKIVSAMRVKGGKPFSPNFKSLESGVQEPSLQGARDAHGYTLSGGASRGMALLELGNHDHRSAPRKPPGLI